MPRKKKTNTSAESTEPEKVRVDNISVKTVSASAEPTQLPVTTEPAEIPRKRGRVWKVLLIIVLILAVAAGGVYSWYYLNKRFNNQQSDMQNQFSQVSSTLQTIQQKVDTLQQQQADAAKNSPTTPNPTDKDAILSAAKSYCIGKAITPCNPTVVKQLDKYAQVKTSDNQLVEGKNSNGTWEVLLGTPSSICNLGVDGPAVAAITALCK